MSSNEEEHRLWALAPGWSNHNPLSGMIFTYNQGVILGGLVELYGATVDANRRDSLIAAAQQIADAATTAPIL